MATCLFCFLQVSAQENSPYSRYALGNLVSGKNAAYRGMAGVCMADDNPLVNNPDNPASYSYLKLTSFQVGVEGISNNIRNAATANRTGSLTLSYVNIGIPVSKRMGISFGLLPFTRAKYAMQQSDSLPGISKVIYDYYGGGGTQKIYVGTAYRFGDYAVGVNTGYLFGNVINSVDETFTDTLKIISSSVTSRTLVGGVFIQPALTMVKKIKGDLQMSAGISYTLSQNANGRKDTYWKSFFGSVTAPQYQYNVDSIVEKRGKVYLPGNLAVGIMVRNGDIWKAGLDVNMSNWQQYRSYGVADSTTKAVSVRLGGSITPDPTSVRQTWKRMSFRGGLYFGKDMLKFNNTELTQAGFTLGAGYPIRRSNLATSMGQLNAAIDIGQRGTLKNSLLLESYTRFVIGFTFNDRWFIKRKYD